VRCEGGKDRNIWPYLDSNLPRLIAGGPKLRDDGETACGTLCILDVDDRAAAETFIKDDPFSKAGLFGKVEITALAQGCFRWRESPAEDLSLMDEAEHAMAVICQRCGDETADAVVPVAILAELEERMD
jgi:hypothetical protein